MFCGLWVLAGLLVFIIAEKAFSFPSEELDAKEPDGKIPIKQEEVLNNNVVEFSSNKAANLKFLNGSPYHQVSSLTDRVFKEKSLPVIVKKLSNKQVLFLNILFLLILY